MAHDRDEFVLQSVHPPALGDVRHEPGHPDEDQAERQDRQHGVADRVLPVTGVPLDDDQEERRHRARREERKPPLTDECGLALDRLGLDAHRRVQRCATEQHHDDEVPTVHDRVADVEPALKARDRVRRVGNELHRDRAEDQPVGRTPPPR